jgi:hypothetical protein
MSVIQVFSWKGAEYDPKLTAHRALNVFRELLQASLKNSDIPYLIRPTTFFLDCCPKAYNSLQGLVIYPDDVLITIVGPPSIAWPVPYPGSVS